MYKKLELTLTALAVFAVIVFYTRVWPGQPKSPVASATLAEPEETLESSEQKARAVTMQFIEALFNRDPETVVKLIETPWFWDGDEYSRSDGRGGGTITDQRDLARRMSRMAFKCNESKESVDIKITGAR
jgi:hypothetical protein